MYRTDGVIYSSDNFQVTSYGNGSAYELRALTDAEPTMFLQGDNAQAFRELFDRIEWTIHNDDMQIRRLTDSAISEHFQAA